MATATEISAASRGEWLDPLNKLIWQKAFRERATTMTLRNGKKYKIRYEKRNVRSLDDRLNGITEMAWVQLDGWVGNGPCGWFRVNEVLNPYWISEGSK